MHFLFQNVFVQYGSGVYFTRFIEQNRFKSDYYKTEAKRIYICGSYRLPPVTGSKTPVV